MRVVLSEVQSGFWLPAAKELNRRFGWDPVYWLTPCFPGDESSEDFKRAFPGAIVHNRFDAVHNRWPHDVREAREIPLGGEWLEELAVAELLGLRMMDRMDPDGTSFTYDERTRHFHRLARRWLGVLDDLKPDVILFQEVPGFVSEYVLYELAKRLHITQVFFSRVWDPDRFLPVLDFQKPSDRLANVYADIRARAEAVNLSLSAQEHIRKMRAHPPRASEAARKYFGNLKATPRKNGIRRWVANVRKALRNVPGRGPTWDKLPGVDVEDSDPSLVESWQLRRKERRRQRELASVYRSLSSGLDGDQRFIYVALHYQPEITTSPQGGMFAQQEHMIRLIAEHLPDDWVVVVKEHPATFNPDRVGSRSRSVRFYRDIAAIPRVQLCPVDVSSFRLIDSSEGVGTVTGTVGWEALCRGKPVLAFGAAWYRECDGCYSVHTSHDVSRAIERIAQGTKPNPRGVELFAAALEEVSYPGYVNMRRRAWTGMSMADVSETLAAAIVETVEGG